MPCYKSENHIQCSEEFYKDCVVQEMALQTTMRSGTLDNIPGISNDIQRMYSILKRMESVQSSHSGFSDFDFSDGELDSDDEKPNGIELTKRLEGVNLDDANAVWSKLTDDERREFEQIVQNEEITAILPDFHPWWENKIQTVLISEINGCSSSPECSSIAHEYSRNSTEHPDIYVDIPEFTQLCTKPPASCVTFNLINILAAYSTTVRFFLGEYMSNSYEAVNYLMAICTNLNGNANFEDQATAIESIRLEAISGGLSMDSEDVLRMKNDIDSLFEGPDPSNISNIFTLAALSDLRQLLINAKAEKKPTGKPFVSVTIRSEHKEGSDFARRFADHKLVECFRLDKSKIAALVKKIEYYLSYVKCRK